MSYETEICAARLRALARERRYSSRSERAPSTCTPVRMRTHPAGSAGIGGGTNRGRVHSLHSRARHLRRASSCASGVRERFQAECVLSRIVLRAFHTRRRVSSVQRAMNGDARRAWSSLARCASRSCFFDCGKADSAVSIGSCLAASRVVAFFFSRRCCGLPAAFVESLRGGGLMRILPSRRHSSEHPRSSLGASF